jgi:ubiquinone/menaquinone biosynthesis C-methylase UbiE
MSKAIRKIAKYFWYYGASDSWRAIYSLLEKSDVLLDLGCGDGSSTMLVAERIGASKVYGIDLDEEKLRNAKGKGGIIVYSADLNRKFPLDDESVNVVLANQVIEHIIDVDNFVSEIYRVLKEKGYAITCTENLASWHNIFALMLGNQPYSGPNVSVKHVIGHHPLQPCPSQHVEETFEATYIARAYNDEDFIARAEQMLIKQTNEKVRRRCGEIATRFSVERSTFDLLRILGKR